MSRSQRGQVGEVREVREVRGNKGSGIKWRNVESRGERKGSKRSVCMGRREVRMNRRVDVSVGKAGIRK